MGVEIEALWAKSAPYHLLWRHLLDVGAVARALLRQFGPIDGIGDELAAFIAAIHDIGKADPRFQFQPNAPERVHAPLQAASLEPYWDPDPSAARKRFPHELCSSLWLRHWLEHRDRLHTRGGGHS